MERIQEIKQRGRLVKRLYYKPDNHKWTVASLVNDPNLKGNLIVNSIEHNVTLPDDTRELHKSERDMKSIENHFKFIDMQYT